MVLHFLVFFSSCVVFGMENQYKSNTALASKVLGWNAVVLISGEGDRFKAGALLGDSSEVIQASLRVQASILNLNNEVEFKCTDFESEVVGLLAKITSQVQYAINLRYDFMLPIFTLREFTQVVKEVLRNEDIETIGSLLYLTDFLDDSIFMNAVASDFISKLMYSYKWIGASYVEDTIKSLELGVRLEATLIYHWRLQCIGITDEWGSSDLKHYFLDQPITAKNVARMRNIVKIQLNNIFL